jgi:hypothetical protein
VIPEETDAMTSMELQKEINVLRKRIDRLLSLARKTSKTYEIGSGFSGEQNG